MKRQSLGFTLIELLTVIAIIAILAAILFPVFAKAKVAAKRGVDSTNMASLYTALQAYRTDQGGYPPLLMQVAEYDWAQARWRSVNEIKRGFLFPGRLKDLDAFKGVLSNVGKDLQVTACWPTYSLSRTPVEWNQAYGPNTVVTYQHLGINPTALNGDLATAPARFYAWDSYDVQQVRGPGGANCATANQPRFELRYILFWTYQAQVLGGGPTDDPRQLGYNDPPDTTVVTWNSYYRDYQGAGTVPLGSRRTELVLFLNGSVRPTDSLAMYQRSWALEP